MTRIRNPDTPETKDELDKYEKQCIGRSRTITDANDCEVSWDLIGRAFDFEHFFTLVE